MPPENVPAPTPVTTDPPAAPIAPTAAPPATTANPAQVNMSSDILKSRLDEAASSARAKLLKELGFDKPEDAKAAIAAAKAAEDAKKTETERLTAQIAELTPQAQRAKDLEAVVKARAESELASLTDAQRAAVVALGGEDHAAQLRAITALRPTWAASPPSAPTPPTPPAPTAPNGAPPAPSSPGATNHLAVWESLQKTNPVEAARYLVRNRAAISEARAKASPTT